MVIKKYIVKDWSVEKIGSFADVVTGGTPNTRVKEYWENGDIPWLASGECKDKEIMRATKFITEAGYKNSVTKMMPSDTVVIALTGATTGKVGLLKIKACANQSVTGIIPNETYDSKYLFYYLLTIRKKILDDSYGGAQKHISQKYVKDIEVPLPPLEIQKKIVKVLDKAQALIDTTKEQIKLLDDLVKSVFYDMFGDPVTNSKRCEVKMLKDFGDWKSGGTPSRACKKYYDGTIPWVSSGELNTMYIDKSNEMITVEAVRNSAAKIMEEGSLMLGMYDTAALKSSISTIQMTCNQAIAFSKLDDKICNTIYIYWCIQIGRDHYKRMQRGVRQKNMNLSMIKGLEIIAPDVKKQNQFAEIVQKIESQKQLMEKSLEEMENNYNSLMQRAFKGELFS